jgi:hypothetical protein
MKATEVQGLLTTLLSDAEKAHQIAKTAVGAKKSLRGDGPYARRFHAVVVALSTTEGKLQSIVPLLDLVTSDLEAFNDALAVLKTDDAKPKDRTASLKCLRLLCESVILPRVQGMTASPVPATEQVLPLSVVQGTRRNYIVQVVVQANGNYERQWYDACSVMIRRLVETLIIEVYEAKGEAEEIKKDGHFFMLSGLIDSIQRKGAWNLQRETQNILPLLKQLGDRAAHSRRYLAAKVDIDRVIPGLRVLADDLLHLANLK